MNMYIIVKNLFFDFKKYYKNIIYIKFFLPDNFAKFFCQPGYHNSIMNTHRKDPELHSQQQFTSNKVTLKLNSCQNIFKIFTF